SGASPRNTAARPSGCASASMSASSTAPAAPTRCSAWPRPSSRPSSVRSLLLLMWVGCAAQNAEGPAHEVEAPDAQKVEAQKAEVQPAPEPPATAPKAGPAGVIQRAELLAILDRSPGAFLQHVDVTPRFTGGRFVGWRVTRLFPGDDRFAH